jgi:D-alanine-D-alanine ligase
MADLDTVTLLPDPTVGGLLLIDECEVIPIDLYFPIFHGINGEDGAIQGLLELADVPYVGSGVLASAAAMDKSVAKRIVKSCGIDCLTDIVVDRWETKERYGKVLDRITKALPEIPLFVKPCHLGSSIGLNRADDRESLGAALAEVFKYDDSAVVEPCIENLMEVNISVVEGEPPRASVTEIPIPSEGALSYQDKYRRGGSKSADEGMAGLTRVVNPQDLDDEIKDTVTTWALEAFRVLGCAGVVRMDFMVDMASGRVLFNEVNPIPGSLAFYLWQKSRPQLLYTHLLDRMMEGALERKRRLGGLKREFCG